MRLNLFVMTLLLANAGYAQDLRPDRVYPKFTIGPTGIEATIEQDLQVVVQSVRDGSPASSLDLQPGDVLLTAGEKSLKVPDPRIPLGNAIAAAEGGNGNLVLKLKRNDSAMQVTVKLRALGRYAQTWPKNCSKSAAIIRTNARYIADSQLDDGSYQFDNGRPIRNDLRGCLASLFLLSTGEDQYLPHVTRHVRPLALLAEERKNAGGHVNWQLGYQGILLGEYYLRTGDKTVLPGLEELCRWCVDNQAAGGWGHGAPVGPGYVQSGLMNHAGVPIVIALILARECGVEVDNDAYARAVKLMYRMAGHGCIAYGDHRSELWWSNTNGRNAMMACGFSLLDHLAEYRAASQHLALLVTDSYYQPEFGHTGGGFNVMWRGIASVHVPDDRQRHYQRQMKSLTWYYDLCRRDGGGFSMLPTPPTTPATQGWSGEPPRSGSPTPHH